MNAEQILDLLFNNDRLDEANKYMDAHPGAEFWDVLKAIYPELHKQYISQLTAKAMKEQLVEVFKGFYEPL